MTGQQRDQFDRYAQAVVIATITGSKVVRFVPLLLRRPAMLVLGIPVRILFWRFRRLLAPHIRQRMADLHKGREESSRDDFLSFALRRMRVEDGITSADDQVVAIVSALLVHMQLLFRQTVPITMTGFLACLTSLPGAEEHLQRIRQEAAEVMAAASSQAATQESGTWNKNTLSKLVFLDSAIRESMRIEPSKYPPPYRDPQSVLEGVSEGAS